MLLVGVNPLTKKLAMIVIINAHIYYFKNKNWNVFHFNMTSGKRTFKISISVLYFTKDSCIHTGHHKLTRIGIGTQGRHKSSEIFPESFL